MKIPQWIPMKRWRYEQAMREHLSETRIAQKLKHGDYHLKIKRINARVVLVHL